MLYLHKKQSPAERGRANVALWGAYRCPRSRYAIAPLRDFSQKQMGKHRKFRRKKSLKKGKIQSILASETK